MKLLKYSLLLLSLFLVNGVFAQERCEIEKVSTTKIDKTDIEEERVTLTIDTKNCDNEKLKIKLKSVKGGSSYTQIDNRIDVLPGYITPQDNQIQLTLDSEESICGTFKSTWGWQCVAAIEIENFTTEEKLFSGFNDPSFTKELIKSSLDNDDKYLQYLTKGIILGNCDTKCGEGDAFENDNDNWDFIETIKGIHPKIASSNCNIKDGDIIWSNYTTQRPVSEQSPQLTINTKNCIGVRLEIDIREDDGVFDDDIEIKAGNQTTDSFSVLVNKETTTLKFKSTNAECDMSGLTPSCRIYVDISHTNKDFSTEQYINQYTSSFKEDISFLSKGVILGYPEISGERSWWDLLSSQVLSSQVSSVKIINTGYWLLLNTDVLENEVINDSPQSFETTPSYDEDSPCYISEEKGYNDNCYEFLAPLPGLGVAQKDASGNETGRYSIKDLGSFQLGEYINTVFEVALGILMVLAVIMIIISGVEYMTVESIYGKSDAKKRITGAITGLILALGIFVILKTINPELLKINFGENINEVTITLADPAEVDGNGSTQTVSNTPATEICNNRKDRGYWKGQIQFKLTKIGETANKLDLGSLVSPEVILDTGTPQGTNVTNKAESAFSVRVKNMVNTLNQEELPTRVTEAFGPSFLKHGSPCHYLGSCIDLATGTSAANATYSIDDVEKIIRTADANGLTAQFEFSKSQSIQEYQVMQNELAIRGIDKCMVKYVRNATNWHFSVYDKITPGLTL
jgi:hypothetical protein